MSDAAWLWIVGFLIVAGPLYLVLVVFLGARAEKRRVAGLPRVAATINADSSFDQAVRSVFFDLSASTPEPSSDADNHDQQTVAMFHFGDNGLPAFRLDPARDRNLDAYYLPADRPRVSLPHRPAFGDKFHLFAEDAAAVRRLFTPRLCDFIEAHDGWSIQSTGTWLAVCRRRQRPALAAYPAFIAEAAEFLVAFGTRE